MEEVCGTPEPRYNSRMKRFRRWVFNGIVVLSFAFCVAATAMWIRSYLRLDDISYGSRWHVHNFSSRRGRVFIQWGWSTENILEQQSTAMTKVVGFGTRRPAGRRLGWNRCLADGNWGVSTVSHGTHGAPIPQANRRRGSLSSLFPAGFLSQRRPLRRSRG